MRPGDLGVLHAHECDAESGRMAGVKPRDEATFRARWASVFEDATVVPRAIVVDGELAGQVTCFERDGQPWIGYWIGRDWWGRGIATRALGALLGEVERRPLYAMVASWNAASRRVLERNGFELTGSRVEPETDRYMAAEVQLFRLD